MLVILKIGYKTLLLPSEQGLQTVLKTLSKAREVAGDDRYKGGGLDLGGPIDLQCEVLTPDWVLSKHKNVLEPEVLPPERRKQLTGRRALTGSLQRALPALALGGPF